MSYAGKRPACPRCGEAAYVRTRFSDGRSLRWWHCRRCGWASEDAGVWEFDDLTARLLDESGAVR